MRLASQTASAARMLFGGMYGDAGITLTTGRVA
jgi:hypothetical protein